MKSYRICSLGSKVMLGRLTILLGIVGHSFSLLYRITVWSFMIGDIPVEVGMCPLTGWVPGMGM